MGRVAAMNRQILITVTGFIGRSLIRRLGTEKTTVAVRKTGLL